jgi:hypothetical protein
MNARCGSQADGVVGGHLEGGTGRFSDCPESVGTPPGNGWFWLQESVGTRRKMAGFEFGDGRPRGSAYPSACKCSLTVSRFIPRCWAIQRPDLPARQSVMIWSCNIPDIRFIATSFGRDAYQEMAGFQVPINGWF